MSETLTIAQALIRKASVTPDDQGCQRVLANALEPYGFSAELMQFGDVQNLWLRHHRAFICFCGPYGCGSHRA